MKKGVKRKRTQDRTSQADKGWLRAQAVARTERRSWTWVEVFSLLLVALTGVYVAIRAARLELSGNEARFWQISLKPGLETMLTLEHLDPGSHFLPGVLALPFLRLWKGNPVTGIRMPGVLSFFLFAWVGWRLGQRLKHGWLRLVLLLGWFGNAVLLEYFSQLQGYGLMVAFTSLACMGVIEAYDRRGGLARQRLWSYVAILSAAAAMLSIMGFVPGFCVIAGLLVLRYGLDATVSSSDTETEKAGRARWRQRLGVAWEQSGFIFATGLAVGVFYLPRYLILQDHPAMPKGGEIGFIHDTMSSLVDTFPHSLPNAATPYLPLIAGALAGLMGINAIAVEIAIWRRKGMREKRAFLESPTILLTVLFAGVWLLSGVAHAVAGVQYPVRPTALFLWPMVVAQCVFAMEETKGGLQWVVRGLNLAALAVGLVVAGQSVNLDHCATNEAMAHQSEIVREVARLAQMSRGRPVVVGISDPMKDTFGYYMETACGLKEAPQTEHNPVFKMFGPNVYIYSLNYELPDDAGWHWHPATTHYLLSEFSGHHPEASLMETEPVAYWQGMQAGLYRALPQEKARGCEPLGTCGICNYFREMTGQRAATP